MPKIQIVILTRGSVARGIRCYVAGRFPRRQTSS